MGQGRPAKYTDPDIMQLAIERYFKHCDDNPIQKPVVQKGVVVMVSVPAPYTMAGLAMTLEIGRRTLNNYTENDDLLPVITRARARIHDHNLKMALVGCYDPRIAALNLSSNFGYSDRTVVDTTFRDDTVDPETLLMVRDMALQIARGKAGPKLLQPGNGDSDTDTDDSQ